MTSTEVMISDLVSRFGTDVTRKNLIDYAETSDVSFATVCNRLKDYKVGRGVYNLTVKEKLERTFNDLPAQEEQTLVPIKDVNYVPFGNFTDVKKIIKSGIFYPTFITGLSGNGKTFSVEQACSQLGRELIRVNITIETDEDDLIGGFRLVDGLYESTLTGAISINGPLAGGAQISGTLDVAQSEIQVPSSTVWVLGDVPDVTHIGAPSDVRQTLQRAGLTGETATTAGGGGPAYGLDITINAPARLFVRGRGLDAELGG